MYKAHWHLRTEPFSNTPDPEFLYESAAHTEAITQLTYAVENRKGAALLTGEFGSGKTLLSRLISQRLLQDGRYNVALVTHPSLSPVQILKEIIYQLTEEEVAGEKQRIVHRLQDYLYEAHNADKSVVVIVDEAQVIKKKEVLDELRMLLNFQMNDRFLLTLLFLGQPELRERIDRYPQLRQRLAVRYHLPTLAEGEVARYIAHRLTVAGGDPAIFTPEAAAEIERASSRSPREINTICDLCLLRGFQRNLSRIGPETVAEVVRMHYAT